MLKMVIIAMLAGIGVAAPASAADNAMQVCGAKYQAAKAGKTLPTGQTWPQFLAACRGTVSKTASATPAPAAKPATAVPAKAVAVPKVAGQQSPAQVASRSRLKQCSQNYQADKAAGKLAGQTWPKYYSACNTRLKG